MIYKLMVYIYFKNAAYYKVCFFLKYTNLLKSIESL